MNIHNEELIAETRKIIALQTNDVEEKKMFGGLCFMVKEKMCVCITRERLMLRIDPEDAETLSASGECTPMIHNGREMKGFVHVHVESLTSGKELEAWVKRALDYNKLAKPSKKKK
ncbi:TfoX/Sxy family protein [Pollutibacter soli]|uniref:TfoX/Sxy family protein n=1 Tax=Pollutibacter soli TaxID=3034157 RepID=UPI0030138275